MKFKLIAAAVVLVAGFGTYSYGVDHTESILGTPIEYSASEFTFAGDDAAACGCEKACGCETSCGCEKKCKCPKLKYYKKVCRTKIKREKNRCGCCKTVTKVKVTKISYRRVLCPKKHCPDDLICATEKPCGSETREPLCGCGCAK